MKIIYRSRTDHKRQAEGGLEPVLQLSWNNWDDYGHKTSLVAHLHIAEGGRQLDPIKVLVAGESFTANILKSSSRADGMEYSRRRKRVTSPIPAGLLSTKNSSLSLGRTLRSVRPRRCMTRHYWLECATMRKPWD